VRDEDVDRTVFGGYYFSLINVLEFRKTNRVAICLVSTRSAQHWWIGGISRDRADNQLLSAAPYTMTLELYILPPLFGLPSLSGSCIAALSLCTLSLDPSSFKVIESTDLTLNLPALKHNQTWIRGYTSIKLFLRSKADIDGFLSPLQKADSIAWGSLIEDLGETLTVRPQPT
jgi:hypothetical protein